MEPGWIAALTTIPFAIVMCVAIWREYAKIAPQLIEVISANAAAIGKFAGAVEANSRTIERLGDALANYEPRLMELRKAQEGMADLIREMRDDDRADRRADRPRAVK